jgi:hypothetical protein
VNGLLHKRCLDVSCSDRFSQGRPNCGAWASHNLTVRTFGLGETLTAFIVGFLLFICLNYDTVSTEEVMHKYLIGLFLQPRTIGRSRFDPRQGQIFLLAPASRPALGPTQPPIQWVPGVLAPGVKQGRRVTLTTHPHLVPRLRMSRNYTSSPPMCLHGM